MKLAISNIAWTEEKDKEVYQLMREYGYLGLEIAPTRIFSQNPYEKLEEAKRWSDELKKDYGFVIPSMQSIWFGRTEKLFADEAQRQTLFAYTKKAVDFASAVQCAHLVFGSPKNRVIPDPADRVLWQQGTDFFRRLGSYAASRQTVLGMEANPAIYQTNYINTTKEAIQLIREVASEGFRLNLDTGTMLENKERVEVLEGSAALISHVHLSEPFLKPIVTSADRRGFHQELAAFLREQGYQGYVSVEMGKSEDGVDRLARLDEILAYGREMFA
mgnify:CR=1 FL=1